MNDGFFVATGLWAVVMLALFIQAIRLSYRIEERSEGLKNRTGLPRYAAMPLTVANYKVARDAETQAMRRRMLILLALVAAGFVLMAAWLAMTGSP
ncbi:hypothetical protein FQ775_01335 [Nitratireductor mangrovi]|uniref:Uncharacterized protein n=1 Tax=Nitratireductor mangrovi TaxID=2599600 RepID=A0A5B8KU57_9HYPH|nr:hypothetical protein [Nitratireductor mangrovi]QDY99123.1 hypothetical protein FQ775_01335 [Nitratireductor mangrovi]